MARRKKGELPSGNIRRQIYNGMKQKIGKDGKPVFDDNGKPVMIRDYISITASNSKDADKEKYDVLLNKKEVGTTSDLTLRQAIDFHIESIRATKSPKTVAGYENIRDNAFPSIMDRLISKLDNRTLQIAIDTEINRKSNSKRSGGKSISAKTLHNEWSLVHTVLSKYRPNFEVKVSVPQFVSEIHELSRPEVIFEIVRGTEIELPVLLAMWLSFTMSEIKGLTKSKSIKGDYLYIAEIEYKINSKTYRRNIAKNKKRNRMHRIPPYIKNLIDQVETDQLVTLSGDAIYSRFTTLLSKNGLPHMSFHDLRHVSASVMSFLDIPTQYAMDRGGWSSDKVMKKTYMQIYDRERVAADDKMDNYFAGIIGMDSAKEKENEKYNAWLLLFDKTDSKQSQKEYAEFVKCNTNATRQ